MGGIYDRKDEEFRLIDVDGEFLGSPGDYIIINEPEDFDEASIKETREGNHGVDFDFFDENSSLIFDKIKFPGEDFSGLDLIESVYQQKGSDLNIKFQYRHNNAAIPVVYEAELIGSSRKRLDYGVSIRAKRVEFDDKFRSRQDISYNLNRNEDLDGNPLIPVSYSDIVLIPQLVIKQANTKKNDQDDIATPASPVRFASLNFGEVLASNFDNAIQTYPTTSLSFVSDLTNPIQTNVLKINRFGYYQVAINVDYVSQTSVNTSIQLVVDVLDSVNQIVLSREIIDATAFTSGVTQTVNISASTTPNQIWGNKGHVLRVYLEAGAAGMNFINTKLATLSITGETRSGYIDTKYVPILSAAQKLTEGITGIESPVISNFLAKQNAGLMSGRLIRGYPESEKFEMKWKDFSRSIEAIFGLGFAVIRRPAGTRVYIDQYSEFYRDVEIQSYDFLSNFLIDTDKDLIANEINLGYEKFSEGTNTTLLNNSNNDFLTVQQYLTPLERDKKRIDYISPFIASGHLIEEGRQQPFSIYPDEKWSEDDRTFIVSIFDGQDTVYNQVAQLFVLEVFGFSEPQYSFLIQNSLPFISSATTIEVDLFPGVPQDIGINPDGPLFAIAPLPDAIVVDVEANTTLIRIENNVGIPSTPGKTSLPLVGTLEVDYINTEVTFDISWTEPETDQAFDIITGVADEKATYNARYRINNMLFSQSLIINSILNFKEDTDKYRLTDFKNNATIQTKFKAGQNFSTLDPDRVTTRESDDLEKQIVNQGSQLFVPEILSWELRVPFNEMIFLKNAHEDALPYVLTLVDATGLLVGEELHQTTGITGQGEISAIDGNDVTVIMLDGKFIDTEMVQGQTTLVSTSILSQTSKNYGYISSLAYDGITYQSYLKEREYDLMSEMFRFTGKRKKQ